MNIFIFVYRIKSTGNYGFGIRGATIVSGQGTFEQISEAISKLIMDQDVTGLTINLVTDIASKQFDVIWSAINSDFEPVDKVKRAEIEETIQAAVSRH